MITYKDKPGHREVKLFHCYSARKERNEFEALRNELKAQGEIADSLDMVIITHDGGTYTLR